MDTIFPLALSRERKKQQESHATQDKLTAFLGLTGKLNFLGHGCLPMAAFSASHLQQSTGPYELQTSESQTLPSTK